ncbi:pathogenicity island protein [Staphylococcus schweitzeri]|nr:pathogenicity island protein [Staphylococcus schweitzeri]CDR66828.1 pathogenicity island protein [Staphylococcus schweitzeri]
MIFSQNLFRRPTPARLTRIEKSLLQAHFRSVNYCQYNFVEHRTLIYVSGSLKLSYLLSYLK